MDKNKKYKLLYKISTSLNCKLNELMKLSDEQVEYINHYLKHSSFLKACPGSGKTEVIGIKSAYDIHKWKSENSGIAIVTFTISAAKELNERIRKFGAVSSESFPHFIGTFDSWIHNYILQPFCHYLTKYSGKDGDKSMRLIDVDSSAGFLANYSTIIYKNNKPLPISVTDYYYDFQGTIHGLNEITDGLLKAGRTRNELDSLLKCKKEFIKAGFVTYSDVEWLCNGLLTKYPTLLELLAKRFQVIIVDECQDLSNGQINILELLRNKGTGIHFVGDLNQSIYEFRMVNPQDILNYIQQKNFTILQLTNNYRSCQPIVDISEKIIGNSHPVVGHEPQHCQHPCLLWQYDAQSFSSLPHMFEKFILNNGLDKRKSLILARGKSTLEELRAHKEKYQLSKVELMAIAFHCWHKSNRNADDLKTALSYLGRAICLLAYNGRGDARNQYCPDAYENEEWRMQMKRILDGSNSIYPYIENQQDLSWTKWIKKLKTYLNPLWNNFTNAIIEWGDAEKKLKSPGGMKDAPVIDICTQVGIKNLFRTTTIHSVKGETLNAALLISHNNKQSKGGHFSHWFREGNYDEEHIRFAYVAMSRPKHALIVATPKLTDAEKTKFQNLGFVLEP